jgi:hypothetical protein
MLPIRDRDRIQNLALRYRDIQRSGSQWWGNKGNVAYIGIICGALVLVEAYGGIIGSRNTYLGTGGTTIALMITIGCGIHYWIRQKEEERSSIEARKIEEEFANKYGAQLSSNGFKVHVEGRDVDPLSNDAYEVSHCMEEGCPHYSVFQLYPKARQVSHIR